MTKYDVYIHTDQNIAHTRYMYEAKSLPVSVSATVPYDKLSQRFKRFTHTIEYTEKIYKSDDYFIYVYDPNRYIYKYLIKYNKPVYKVISVDLFFSLSDKSNSTPLVLGFHQENQPTIYYTANFLYYYTSGLFAHQVKNHYLPKGSFGKDELINRLLEELGLYKTDRKNKFVFRLDKKSDTLIKYPQGGFNAEKIILTRSTDSNLPNYEKYEHSIIKTSNVESFYVSLNIDSVYFQRESSTKSIFLQNITVYYSTSKNKIPLLFVFNCRNPYGTYYYRLSEFQDDLLKPIFAKKITELSELKGNELQRVLDEENNKFRQLQFRDGSRDNINVSESNVCLKETKFFSVLFTPNTIDGTEKGEKRSSFGPWIVYSGSLFYKNPDIKIDKGSFQNIYNDRFKSVDVYYNDKNEPLLVEFVNDSNNRYFVRQDIKANKWAEEYKPRYASDGTLSLQLQKISNPLFTNLGLVLEKKKDYDTTIMIKGANRPSRISVMNPIDGPSHFQAEGYVCYEHKLFDYYERYDTQGITPKLILEPAIGTIQIRLLGPHDTRAWPLTYTNPDHSTSTKNESVFVYFSKGNSGSNTRDNDDSDTLPLLFLYNDKFYTPKSNNQYFGLWVDAGITGSTNEGDVLTPQKRLKEVLDRNFSIANEIDLTKTKSYGLQCCSDHPYYYKPAGFTSKRVHVTGYMNNTHTMYVHRSVFKNNISKITHGNPAYNFNSHTRAIKDKTINQVVVIYTGNGDKTNEPPVLVLLNQTSNSEGDGLSDGIHVNFDAIKQPITHGYYYQDKSKIATPISYNFHHVTENSKIMPKLMGYQVEAEGLPALADPNPIQPILEILNSIGSTKMLPIQHQNLSELDTSACKGPALAKKIESSGMCEEVLGPDVRLEEEDDEEEEDDDEEEEEEDEVDDQHLGHRELKYLVRSQEGLEYAVREGHIVRPSGIDGSASQDSDSNEEQPPGEDLPPRVESTEDRPAAAAKPAAAKPAPARPPGPDLRTPDQITSLTSAQAPSSVSHTSTQSRDTSLEVPKAKEAHLPERGRESKPGSPDSGQIDHDRAKLPKLKATEEVPNYIVVISLTDEYQYEIRDYLQYLDRSIRENALNTKDYVNVNPKEESIWNRFKDSSYKVYEHDFKKSFRNVHYKPDKVEFKFIVDVNYRPMVLDIYNSEELDQPLKLNYKSSKKNIHVYFARDRPKPLLFCCNGNLYRPKSHDYDKNWFKLSGVKCLCSSVHGSLFQQLLQELKKIDELLKQNERAQTTTVHHHSNPEPQDAENTSYAESSAPSTGTIAGVSGGTITTAALVGGGVTYAVRPEWVITSIKALL